MRCTVEGVASLGICLCHTSRFVKCVDCICGANEIAHVFNEWKT